MIQFLRAQVRAFIRASTHLLTRLLLGLIRVYQLTLSPYIGGQCRFHPTCSHYAQQALARHGLVTGMRLALVRIAKCQPFHAGGVDEVPETAPQQAPLTK